MAAEAQVLVVMPALIVVVQVAAMLLGKRLLVVCSWKITWYLGTTLSSFTSKDSNKK
jgi:hypothetical protein